jgi:pectinesterase
MCGPMNLLDPEMIERVEVAAQKPEGHAILDFLGGATPSDAESMYREASPLTHLSRRTPPMLFIDGQFDRPQIRYTEFWSKMDQLQIPHQFVMMPRAPHPFWNMREWFEPTVDAVDRFLHRHLAK